MKFDLGRTLYCITLAALICIGALCFLLALGAVGSPGAEGAPWWAAPATLLIAVSIAFVGAYIAALSLGTRPILRLAICAGPIVLTIAFIAITFAAFPHGY
ncbi:MAG: hypothetical protein NT015_06920 [Alphaproteobacteria bacterium]|nr:hypothetical protein [Alphaproteobacteria bacterium]